jgi:Tfp pilus assembly protein PilE
VIDPALGSQLADLGGFALFLLTVVTAVVGLHRQWVVPGWVYRQERAARMRAETQALRNAESLEKLARAVSGDRTRRHAAHEPADDPR